MAGLEAYVAGVPGGLGAFADDPMGAATAAMESRRRAQVENGRAPAWMRDIGANIGNLADQTVSSFIPPALRDRLPSPEMVGNLVLGALPGSGDYMAARDALESSAASLSALGRGDYMGAGARGVDALAAGLGIMPFLPYLASIKGVKNPIRAYHGSPHDFDKFSMDKIGTGEGAQAYGHGLYFAESEDVARTYRNDLSRRNVTGTFDGMPLDSPRDWWSAVDKVSGSDWRVGKFLDLYGRVGGDKDWFVRQMRVDYADQPKMLAALEDFAQRIDASHRPGRMYEVNIHADPERFLDWDAPIKDQPIEVRNIAHTLERMGRFDGRHGGSATDQATGADIWKKMRSPFPAREMGYKNWSSSGPAEHLNMTGIPGIKYLDQGSRAAGDGSRNYVVFDDKLIEILRKYGIMAPVTGLGALVASGQDDPNL